MTAHSDAAHADGHHEHHVASTGLFVKVFLSLMFLTFITVWISRFDFGSANMLVAMAIAACKASLVMTFFMHLKWDTAINNITILSSFLFLSLLFVFTLGDQATRALTSPDMVEKAPESRIEMPWQRP